MPQIACDPPPVRAGGANTLPATGRDQAVQFNVARCFLAALLATLSLVSVPSAQEQTPTRRDVTIVAYESTFEPNQIAVTRNDLVRVTLTSEKFPRTFAIDAYRISKRVAAGQSITFEFHANLAGTFTFYCNLTSVPACRDMKGTLVVTPK